MDDDGNVWSLQGLAQTKVMPSPAHDLFQKMMRHHVEQPLNVFEQITTLLCTPALLAVSSGARALTQEATWRHFTPPLQVFSVSIMETFIESYFFERYTKADGTHYANKDEWLSGLATFNVRHSSSYNNRFSFQSLDRANEIYLLGFGKNLLAYPKINLVRLQFHKRHLFAHRSGLIDMKFIQEYNAFHSNDPSMHIAASMVGKIASLERSWIRDGAKVLSEFADFITT